MEVSRIACSGLLGQHNIDGLGQQIMQMDLTIAAY